MKCTKLENKLLDFIKKHIDLLFVIAITLIGLFVRYKFRNFIARDYGYVGNWYNYIKDNGGLFALKETFANYNQPYLIVMALFTILPFRDIYVLKIIAILSDFLLAFSACLLTKEMTKKHKMCKIFTVLSYSVVFLLPTVLLNGSLWAQCDAIYTSFVLLSLYFLVKEKYHFSFIALGCAYAFKLQFIFILPLYLILYFKERKFSIFNFLYLPAVNFVLCLPSILVGHPLKHIFTIYLEQVSYYKATTLNMINFYSLLPGDYDYMSMLGYSLLLLVLGIILYMLIKFKEKMTTNSIMTLGLLIVCCCVYFLPNMHERYLFMGDVLSVVWYFCHRDKIIVPLGINFISLTSYMPFLFKFSLNQNIYISVLYLSIIIILVYYLYNEINGSFVKRRLRHEK